jgi:hypothetical protein
MKFCCYRSKGDRGRFKNGRIEVGTRGKEYLCCPATLHSKSVCCDSNKKPPLACECQLLFPVGHEAGDVAKSRRRSLLENTAHSLGQLSFARGSFSDCSLLFR